MLHPHCFLDLLDPVMFRGQVVGVKRILDTYAGSMKVKVLFTGGTNLIPTKLKHKQVIKRTEL